MIKDDLNNNFLFIAGPCSIENMDHLESYLKLGFFKNLRGGLYKMRTQSESFQGLRESGFSILKELKDRYQFNFVSEITDPRDLEQNTEFIDIIQIGSRNMYNYDLLKEVSKLNKPVLLKRGFSATFKEWMGAAGYLRDLSDDKIMLCERGIRTFVKVTRNTLDLGTAIHAKQETGLKVIIDPSHAGGNPKFVKPLSLATVAAGLDGVIIESHNNPEKALSDGDQAIKFEELKEIHGELKRLCSFYNRVLI